MNTIILFLAITLAGQEPVTIDQPEPSLKACIADMGKYLEKVEAGHMEGDYQASCVIGIPKSVDG